MVRQVYFVLIAVNKEASSFPLPFIINFGHWYNPHLVSLSQDFLLGKLAGVTGNQLSRGHLDHVVIHRLHPANHQLLLLEGDLAGHIPDEIIRDVQLVRNVFRGVNPPADGELNKAEDVGGAVTGSAAHLPSSLKVNSRLWW